MLLLKTLYVKKHFIQLCLLLCLVAWSLLSCALVPSVSINGTPIASSPTNVAGSQGTPQMNIWYKGTPGVEVRYENWKSPGDNEDTITIVRFDLRYVKLSVAYQPSDPLLMSEWMQKEHATAIINGGYFDEQDNATALIVSDGQAFGSSYNRFGGMLSVDTHGSTTLRSLHDQPYDPNNDQLQQATQSSPMLILNGKATQFNANAASSRRSVVAMDKQGRLLFIASPNLAFSLGEFADLLAASDLSIDRALNLDGGASTGLYMKADNQQASIDSIAKLPIVIIAKGK